MAVLGASTDSIESHLKFANKFGIPFPLLADTDGRICRLYGVARTTAKGIVRARRVSFLIDKSGKIEVIWDPVKAAEHNTQVLEYLRMRTATRPT